LKIQLTTNRKSKKAIFMDTVRWVCYCLLLLFFYSMYTNPSFSFSAGLMIPLAVAVSFFEDELPAGIFAIFCGFFYDLSSSRLFGFTSFWLLIFCVAVTLLRIYVFKQNLFNYLWQNAVICLLIGFLDYIFFHWLFEGSGAKIALYNYILPAMALCIVFSSIIYFIIRKLKLVLAERVEKNLDEAAEDSDYDDEDIRT